MIEWSPQQSQALDDVNKWYQSGQKQVYKLMGYAGTGKTTLAKYLADQIGGYTSYCAFTGKAALVMNQNGCNGASTIHSLIYKPLSSDSNDLKFKLNYESVIKHANLVVIDECSMVDEEIGKDMLSFGTPLLVLGDPAQLPPVKGGGFFTNGEPDTMLTEIHRQSLDNPIVKLATDVRNQKRLSLGDYGTVQIINKSDCSVDKLLEADQILVGLNKTRNFYNRKIRELKGFNTKFPQKGDRIICLKNDKNLGIFNGGMFNVLSCETNYDHSSILIQSEDLPDRSPFTVKVKQECFTGGLEDLDWRDRKGYQEFDYGYAITVHKAQGSQWNNVCIFDESSVFRDDAWRHRYTAITRAAKQATIII